MAIMGYGDDPGEHTVEEVRDFLDSTDEDAEGDAEADRVLVAERAGKARKGILSAEAEAEAEDAADEAADTAARGDAEEMGYTLRDVTDAANNPTVVEN